MVFALRYGSVLPGNKGLKLCFIQICIFFKRGDGNIANKCKTIRVLQTTKHGDIRQDFVDDYVRDYIINYFAKVVVPSLHFGGSNCPC